MRILKKKEKKYEKNYIEYFPSLLKTIQRCHCTLFSEFGNLSLIGA